MGFRHLIKLFSREFYSQKVKNVANVKFRSLPIIFILRLIKITSLVIRKLLGTLSKLDFCENRYYEFSLRLNPDDEKCLQIA